MAELALFASKFLVVLVFLVILVLIFVWMSQQIQNKDNLEVTSLHDKYRDWYLALRATVSSKEELKDLKKALKADKKAEKKAPEPKNRKLYVLDFDGDVQAHQVDSLREEITAILQVAKPDDEVLLRLESPGGTVHGYGLAAAELLRIKNKNIPLTICVDKVAASGGYMMASVADKIVASPFAIIGSIGVVAQVPNFNDLLKKHDVKFKEYTAGDYKRTITVFGEITEKGEKKFIEQLEETHVLFKNFIRKTRSKLDIEKVATGEYWFGTKALELGLIDEIQTSDEYILSKIPSETYLQEKGKTSVTEKWEIYEISFEKKVPLSEKISDLISMSLVKGYDRLAQRFESSKHL